jgi:hypothetical protein
MEHAEIYFVNVGFCIVYILNKWIQLQYGGKCYSNLGAFWVNWPSRMVEDMSIEGANMSKIFLNYFRRLNNPMQKRCV